MEKNSTQEKFFTDEMAKEIFLFQAALGPKSTLTGKPCQKALYVKATKNNRSSVKIR